MNSKESVYLSIKVWLCSRPFKYTQQFQNSFVKMHTRSNFYSCYLLDLTFSIEPRNGLNFSITLYQPLSEIWLCTRWFKLLTLILTEHFFVKSTRKNNISKHFLYGFRHERLHIRYADCIINLRTKSAQLKVTTLFVHLRSFLDQI